MGSGKEIWLCGC